MSWSGSGLGFGLGLGLGLGFGLGLGLAGVLDVLGIVDAEWDEAAAEVAADATQAEAEQPGAQARLGDRVGVRRRAVARAGCSRRRVRRPH